MPASHHPAPLRASSPPRQRTEFADDVAWEETSAVFDLVPMDSARPPPGSAGARYAEEPQPSEDDVGKLFAEYQGYVGRIGRRILGHSSEVDDLIQDVFLATVRDVHKVKDPGRLRAWLGTVTTRMAKRRRFRRSVNPTLSPEDLDELVDLATDEGPGPESTADLSDNIQKLLSLPDELRLPWVLKHVEGHTLEDVARQCDCSLSTAQRRIQTVSERFARRR
jgi:RNA polymerase sigma-70 factor (ECF subfamily)